MLLFNPTPIKIKKIKTLRKWKILREISFMCTKNHNHMMYDSWDMEWDRQNFLSFWAIFYPFTPQTIRKIKILKKGKKAPGDIIGLHQCTTNDNHLMYYLWDVVCDGQNFLSFWTIFCPFTLLTTPKIKIFKKTKKCLEILSFYKCVQ